MGIFVPSEDNILCPGSFPQDVDPNGECYFGPEINVQSGTPWSQASQEQATLILEENLRSSSLRVPTELKIMVQPNQAFEMSPFAIPPKLYTVDKDGKFISELGTDTDPWTVTASKLTGDGNLVNNITCYFAAGYCDFTVGGRKLSVKVTSLPTLQPQNTTFAATVSIWDDGLDMPVDANVVPVTAISCSVAIQGATDAVLAGSTEVNVVDGVATFDDLRIEGVAEGIKLQFSCEDATDFNHIAVSDAFNSHAYPDTGMLRASATGFTYKGKVSEIQSVLDALASFVSNAGN